MEPLPINVSSMPSTVEMLAEATKGSAGVAVMPTVMTNQAWHEAVRQHEGEQCWVWCFMAPWEWALMQPEVPSEQSWLAWIDAQRQVLQLRRLLGPQLQFVRATQLPRFLASLDQAADQETPHNLPLFASAADPELATTLATLHLEIVPHSQALESAWEVFETLEAAAWLPEGAAPLFRDSLANTHVNWPLLLPLLHAGCEAPALREQVGQHKKALEEHEQEVAALRSQQQSQQQASQREREEVEEENALLLAQLHQVQEELETYSLNQQALEQREKALQDDVSQLQKRLAEHQTEQSELQEENDLLLSQLHQVQEELERYFLANREYQAAMGSARQTFIRARAQVSQLAQKAS
ncbi:hypothetical protein [Vreelandella arctica]|uniref:hypothetical protein n=1 Tax=Vreelandella arctica TaxID=3126499 RepID=UPI00300E0898